MRRMARRTAALLLACALAACGTGRGEAKAPEETAAPPGVITYWSLWNEDEPQAAVLRRAAAAFEAETGIRVNLMWMGRRITEKLPEALAAGEPIDLFDDDMQRIATRFAGFCLDLESMAAEAGYETYAIPSLTAAVRGWAGSLLCIPYQPYTSGVFFTRSSFEAAGLTDENGDPAVPGTWQEFLGVCEALKAAGYLPLAQDDAFVRYLYGFLIARIAGQEAVSELVRTGGWTQNAAARQAALCVEQLRENGYLRAEGAEPYPAGEDRLGQKSAAMVVNASWLPFEVAAHTGCEEEWGFFNFPDLGGRDPATVANVGAQAMAVNRDSRNPQAAFQFILYVTSGRWDQAMSEACNSIPVDARNTEWPDTVAGVREGFLAQTGAYDWNMGLNDNPAIADALRDNLLKLFAGEFSAGRFLEAMDAAHAQAAG